MIQGFDLNHLRRDTDHVDMLNAFDHFLKQQDQIAHSKLDSRSAVLRIRKAQANAIRL